MSARLAGLMKNLILPAVLLALAGAPATAQVTVNPGALDPAKPAKPAPSQPQAQRPAARPVAQAAMPTPPAPAPMPAIAAAPPALPALAPTANPPAQPVATPDMPPVPMAAPPPPVLPPPTIVPTRPPAPPGPAPIVADAPGAATPLPDGLRVTFGPGRGDLSPATADAIRAVVRPVAKTATFNVTSLAAGDGDDASAARRLSLSRGLAIRALMIGEGVASTRIYVRALGANTEATGTASPDRADIAVVPDPAPPRSAP